VLQVVPQRLIKEHGFSDTLFPPWPRRMGPSPPTALTHLASTMPVSTIAQTIVKRLFTGDRLNASCSQDFEDRSNLHSMFTTLAI